MNRDELLTVMADTCTEILGVDKEAVRPEATLREDLEADSLDLAELSMALEDRVGVAIPDQALKDVVTVADTLDVIEQHLTASVES